MEACSPSTTHITPPLIPDINVPKNFATEGSKIIPLTHVAVLRKVYLKKNVNRKFSILSEVKVSIPPVKIKGLCIQTFRGNEARDIHALWKTFKKNNTSNEIQNKNLSTRVELHTCYEKNLHTIIVGHEVSKIGELPEDSDIVAKEIPARTYHQIDIQTNEDIFKLMPLVWDFTYTSRFMNLRNFIDDFAVFDSTGQDRATIFLSIDDPAPVNV